MGYIKRLRLKGYMKCHCVENDPTEVVWIKKVDEEFQNNKENTTLTKILNEDLDRLEIEVLERNDTD